MANYFEQVLLNAKKHGKLKSAKASPAPFHGDPPQGQLDGLVALLNQRRLTEVVQQATVMAAEFPNAAILYGILGAAHMGLRNLDGAIASFSKAVQIRPGFAPALNNLGVALKDQGRLPEAVASFSKAVQLKPDYAEAHYNLGVSLHSQGLLEEAIASLGKALKIKPNYAEAHRNLCGIYERNNNNEEFERALEDAIRHCGEDHVQILFCLAQLASRKKQFEAALSYLNRIQVEKFQPSLKEAYFGLLGKVCDKLGQSEQAFSAFRKQNELTIASAEAKNFSTNEYLNTIQMRKNAWATDLKPNWTRPVSEPRQISPTFLIGFPRSGTTLLDTILRSHPGINVVEEKPMAGAMSKAFNQGHTIENLNGLSPAGTLELRAAYFNELQKHLDQDGNGKLVVDKYPLNIARVGLIHRVFPDAKFILALRHPCDCVLSCFMQTFKLNDAMMNFLSLEQSAALYAAVMELWSAYRQKLNLDVHLLKYEDLVQDLEGTCKPLIGFLGLEWDDNLHNYQKTASERGSINTPSYSQIVQPLYTQASGRWTNYRKQMEPVLPMLQPWIEAFGY